MHAFVLVYCRQAWEHFNTGQVFVDPLPANAPGGSTIMRRPILRAGAVAALLVLAASACANPRAAAVACDPEAVRGSDAAPQRADSAPPWMTDALLGALRHPTGAAPRASAPAETRDAERQPNSRQHQDPAFPAAFVFQSHSALFLAVNTNTHPAARRGTVAG